jgi:hypothetical protein
MLDDGWMGDDEKRRAVPWGGGERERERINVMSSVAISSEGDYYLAAMSR